MSFIIRDEVLFVCGKVVTSWEEVIELREALPTPIHVSCESVLPGDLLHAGKVVYLLVRLHLDNDLVWNAPVVPKQIPVISIFAFLPPSLFAKIMDDVVFAHVKIDTHPESFIYFLLLWCLRDLNMSDFFLIHFLAIILSFWGIHGLFVINFETVINQSYMYSIQLIILYLHWN